MRKSKLALLAGALLTIFTLFSCQQPITPGNNTFTVKFDVNGEIKKNITVNSGATITDSQKPANPNAIFNYFAYWSESKASQAASTEFNFSTPITKDTTLYAIFIPQLSTYAIKTLSPTQIEIQLYDPKVFPLTDGSYAGIKFQHSTDGTNYQDYPLSIPSSSRDDSLYRYLTYTFPQTLPAGTNYIKVTNGYQSHSKSVESEGPMTNPKTVTFNDCDSTSTIQVEAGQPIPASKQYNPSKSYNTFLYWSTSKASKATALEFDFNTAITDDITLYAIYAPNLYSINTITPTQIEIKFSDKKVFPLDDGSYAGLKVQYSSDDSTYRDVEINIPANFYDSSSYRYVTYSFPSTFSLDSGASRHYFKATSGNRTVSKDTTITTAAAATNLSTETNDSYAKVSFKSACAGWSHKVDAIKNGTVVASKTLAISDSNFETYVEFFGLSNGTEYTFRVTTEGSSYSVETTATPSITQKTSDWLVVMYMDGDNNLNDPIFMDMNEVECGLYYIRNSNDQPESYSDSVNAVALWDGAVSWTETNEEGEEVTKTPQIGKSGTYIYELGRDSGSSTTYTTSAGCVLSANTKNLSYTAPWLVGTNQTISTSLSTDAHGELNMGDKKTLINFLNWVNAHYSATKGVILQFSDHGGGPRSVRYVKTADGRTIKVGDTSGRRALCWDDSSSSNYLKTKDVSDALQAAGYGPSNKAAMILMDVCLGSSLEDAYQFKDYANYLAASPNNIPGKGLDYYKFIQSFSKNTTIDAVAKHIVADYKTQYGNNTTLWNNYAQAMGYDSYSSITDTNVKQNMEWLSDLGFTTFTITDLTKIADVKTAIDSLCEVLLSNTGKTIYVDANGYFSPTATSTTRNYVTYLGQHHANIVNILTNTTDSYSLNDYIYYQGTYTWLYDIGYIARRMQYFSASTITTESSTYSNENAWLELNTAATNLITKLNDAIKYSWRDSQVSSNKDFYSRIDGNTTQFSHSLGLTICGANIATNGTNLAQGSCPSFYKKDLAFGADSKWGDLLTYWFGTGN